MNQSIRRKAEEILREGHSPEGLIANSELPAIIHELHVHQIELEMQNDELRLAQEALQKTQKKYFDLFNFAPVGYLTLDQRGIVKDINLSGATMLERERRFVTERPFIAHLESTQRIFMDHLDSVFKSQYPQTCELILKSQTRQQTYVRLRSVVRSDDTGPICWSVMTDITDLRQAENARMASEAQLHLALESVPMGIWHKAFATNEVIWSEHVGPIFGLSRGQKIQNFDELLNLVHPADRFGVKQAVDGSRHGRSYTLQFRVVWPNGEIHWIESQGRSYLDPSGKPVEAAGTIRDITARKEMELALQEEQSLLAERVQERTAELVQANQALSVSQQRTEALYKFSRVIMEAPYVITLLDLAAEAISTILPADRVLIYHLDSEQEEVLHFVKAGPGAQTTPQVSYEELSDGLTGWVIREGKPALSAGSALDPRESTAVQQRREEVRAGSTLVVPMVHHGKILGTVTAVNPPDGLEFTEDDVEMIQSMANQTAVILKNISLTDSLRSQSQALTKANLELARTARLKDEFLANMSHELRSPLNAILGMSELLKKHVYGELNVKQQRAVNYIDEGGTHLLNLINDILDISKIEAEMLTLSLSKVPIVDMSEASLRFVKAPAMAKNIKLTANIDPSLGTIEADERRLKQILVNLLYNAVKFTPDDGEVGLDVSRDTENSAILFSVWDTGIGISEADQQRLFEPFVQIDSRLAREHEGTGLGLALVYRLTELHGGSVHLQSTLGQGSRFTITLPLRSLTISESSDLPETAVSDTDDTSTPQPDRQRLSQFRILLAEDNEANIVLVTDGLQSYGYSLIVARNGEEAVQLARDQKPDIILMDIQMPRMDGLEAIRYIRADEDAAVAQIPIIGLTALAMSGDKERVIQAGANEYLSKPASLRKLCRLMDSYLLVDD